MSAMLLDAPRSGETPREDGSRIGPWVLDRLGTPTSLCRVDTKHLWGQHYRVNVVCWAEGDRPIRTLSITDSFHVIATDDGYVSRPEIDRKY